MDTTCLGIRHAAVEVTDLPRALRFYRETLGLQPYYEGDADWAMLSCGGTTLSLLPVQTPRPTAPAKGKHQAHVGLVFESPEGVDAAHTRLQRLGCPVEPTHSHRDGSYGFYARDPDGNTLECIFIPLVPRHQVDEQDAWVLLAHGSRDPRWAEPFKKILHLVRLHSGGNACALAFMEFASPTLLECVAALCANKAKRIAVIPVFLSSGGGHMSRDVPALVDEARAAFPGTQFTLGQALGEHPGVQNALVAAALEQGVGAVAAL